MLNLVLMSLTGYAISAFILLAIVWLFYLAIMMLQPKRDNGTLKGLPYFVGMCLLTVGLVLDVLANWLVMTVLLLELPRETTITERLRRLKYEGSGFRQALAVWFGNNLLDPYDPSGQHLTPRS